MPANAHTSKKDYLYVLRKIKSYISKILEKNYNDFEQTS